MKKSNDKKRKSFKDLYQDLVYNSPQSDRQLVPDVLSPKEYKVLYDEIEDNEIEENYTGFQSKFRRHYLSNERMTFRQFLEKVESLIDELI